MPYTAKFEVSASEVTDANLLAQPEQLRMPSAAQTASAIANSILPSLSSAGSASHTPAPGTPTYPNRDKPDPGSAEQFFAKARRPAESGTLLADTVNERLGSQLVQPRSRFQSPVVPSLVVEKKKASVDLGLAGLKINRSSSNLSSGSPMPPNPRSAMSSAELTPQQRARSSLSKFASFTLGNQSQESLADDSVVESDPPKLRTRTLSTRSDPFDTGSGVMDDDDDVMDGQRLAPYGGFSRPDLEEQFLNQTNVFEHAPWKIVKTDKGNGSLINAMHLAEEKNVISGCKWVGTMSSPSDAIPERVLNEIGEELHNEYGCESVVVDDMTFEGHYKSFCKQILWPTLHYQIPDDPKLKAFEEHSYGHYKLVNQKIADKLVETYKHELSVRGANDPEPVIWVHDYHLLLVPAMVKEKCPEAKVGFFLHVSFPSSEVFRCLAQREALLEGLLAADSIVFQTEEYVRHFLQTCNRLVLADTSEFGVIYKEKFTSVNTIPIGIDAATLAETVQSKDVVEWRSMIRDRWKTQTLLVSRDKLDKLRGVKQKLLAYEKFLLENPDKVETTVLVQIFLSSSEDEDYGTEVMQIISRINSLSKNFYDTQPVVVLHRDIDFDQYLGLLAEAEVFIVSSMREGLNLTCHEFIVATADKKSPLILSEFTGSSQLLDCKGRGALLVNPWDMSTFSKTINKALSMSKAEKEERWKNCDKIVVTHDSVDWVKTCLNTITEAWKRDHERCLTNIKPLTQSIFDKYYSSASGKRLFFINLDNPTRSGIFGGNTQARKSVLEYSRIGTILHSLSSDPNNHVYFSSVMTRSELSLIFKNVSRVGLIAELGGFIRLVGETKWISISDEEKVSNWIPQVSSLIQSKAERLPGSLAVIEECTVRLLADAAMAEDPKRSLDVMGDIIQHINDSFGEPDDVHASIVNNSVVVQSQNITVRAINFLLAYYTSDLSLAVLTAKFNVKRVASTSDNFIPDEKDSEDINLRQGETKVKLLFYSGGLNPIDETIYDYVNDLEKDNVIEDILTVAVRGGESEGRTSATYSVLGQNELFVIISKV